MVDFDHKLSNVHRGENLVNNLDTLGVRDHCVVLSGNVKVALVELPGDKCCSKFYLLRISSILNAKLYT